MSSGSAPAWKAALVQGAYRLSPALWCDQVLQPKLGIALDRWQWNLVMAPRGKRIAALVYRQAGKSTACAVAIAHSVIFREGSTSLALAPTQRQSSEIIRKTRAALLAADVKLTVDNTFSLEANGSRLVALPGSDDAAIRGLSIDGELVIDEAARVDDALYAAVRPMMARHADKARLVLASTAWLSSGFFYDTFVNGSSEDWMKLEAKPQDTGRISQAFLDAERRALGPRAYAREYENVFDSDDASVFSLVDIDAAFGTVIVPTPPLKPAGATEAGLDPVTNTQPAFTRDPFGTVPTR